MRSTRLNPALLAAALLAGAAPVLLCCLATEAHATIIADLASGPIDQLNGRFAFNYTATLSGNERLDPAATNGVTCPGLGGPVQCNPAGTFFTIYDIKGFFSGSSKAAGWTVTTFQSTGVTPSSINGASIDDPTLVNVTFRYSGPVVHANGTDVVFSGFQIISTLNGVANGNFSSPATKDFGDQIGLTDQAVGPVTVPAGVVPEPASLLLVSGGLTWLSAARARRQGA